MGFFSSIKKFWKVEEPEKAAALPTPAESPEQQRPSGEERPEELVAEAPVRDYAAGEEAAVQEAREAPAEPLASEEPHAAGEPHAAPECAEPAAAEEPPVAPEPAETTAAEESPAAQKFAAPPDEEESAEPGPAKEAPPAAEEICAWPDAAPREEPAASGEKTEIAAEEPVAAEDPETATPPATAQAAQAAENRAASPAAPPAPLPEQPRAVGGFFAGLKKLLGGKDDAAPAAEAAPQAPEAAAGIDDRLALALRSAEPRLSVWLGIALEGVEQAGDLLWRRLSYLLRALETPENEAEQFIKEFKTWLERMDYVHVQEFRSELQYRLALALELEDEEDERNRLLLKLSSGLARTREQIARGLDAVFSSHKSLSPAFWEELEEIFIMADMGPDAALRMVKNLKERAQKEGVDSPEDVRGLLRAELADIFRSQRRISAVNPPEVVLLVGVNGVGKTTTIAKLAHRARMQGRKALIAAGDTFRAAAVEQLGIWAERVGAGFHCREHGADPAAVAYEAMDVALRDGYDLLFVDTAGRLHTKINLMEELTKIRNVLGKKHPGAPHRTILVIDATTGQNALAQTKMFKEAAKVDEIILTKLDGTAKGGVAIAVAMQYDAPITFIGLGEKLEDLRPFNGEDFAAALLEGYGRRQADN